MQGRVAGDDDASDGLLARRSTMGRYLIIERIGSGGMGLVYAAYDPQLDRKVAIKLLRFRDDGGDQQLRRARLEREAKAIAKLSHPNVVGIFDVGVHDGQVFLAVEHLAGGTLRDWLGEERRPWRAVLKMFAAAGSGLAAAHGEGLVHRDFKPDNVLLDKSGTPKVVDFGVVRFGSAPEVTEDGPLQATVDETSGARGAGATAPPALELVASGGETVPALVTALTRAGTITGTPAYMAPEQFLGGTIDERTDQFAFCVSLYEALYGERPFAGDTVVQIADAVSSGRMREAPREADVPGWVRKVVLRGLSADPASRYPSVVDLLQALSVDPAARRRRRAGAIAAVLIVAALGIGLQRRFEARRSALERTVAARVGEGTTAFSAAKGLKERLLQLRARSFALFDARDRDGGERVWAEARAASTAMDGALDQAEKALEAALGLDEARAETRRRLSEIVFERAALAELELRREDLARHLATLATVDASGEARRQWQQPGSLSLQTSPAGAKVTVERFDLGAAATRINATRVGEILSSPITARELAPGSYRLHIEKAGYADTLYPFVVRRGEAVSIDVPLPRGEQIPAQFRYVPAGRFFYGEHDEDLRVSFCNAVPLHERDLSAYLISAQETTFSEWIAFLSDQSPAESKARLPGSSTLHGAVQLARAADGDWKLRLNISDHVVEAVAGSKLVYPARPQVSAVQDWLAMPVLSVSVSDMRAYLSWLSATGRVPGARLCTDAEWERAARGADERAFPSSLLRLAADDANVDTTYGRKPGAYGPDAVGRHPASRSPFGVDDMAGNAWEVVESDDVAYGFVIRGGSYYQRFQDARSTNREPIEIDARNHLVGFRVCADWPNEPKGERNR